MPSQTTTDNTSILVLGASGQTGLVLSRHLANHPSKPSIHAFCRSPEKMDPKDHRLFASAIKGDARKPEDLERALRESRADYVIVTLGYGLVVSKSKNTIRTESAQALVPILRKPEFQHVRTIVISSTGAGNSKIIYGLTGRLVAAYIRHVIRDHTGQEEAFKKIANRTEVIRLTGLHDDEPTGKLVTFADREPHPNITTQRADLAAWVVDTVTSGRPFGGHTINATSANASATQ